MSTTTLMDFSLTQNPISQKSMSTDEAIERLKAGNQRYVSGIHVRRDFLGQVKETASGQYPFAAILSCIDSRIPTEIVFDQGVGDVFNARIAGNFVNDDILGSLEFACKAAGSKVIVVMGHTSCGAIKGAADNVRLGNLTGLLQKIHPALEAVQTGPGEDRSSNNTDFVNRVAHKNVELAIAQIVEQSPVLEEMFRNDEIDIVGAMYDVATGEVRFYD